jgi:hypothetical protein
METEADRLARSLIANHGVGALFVAERAADGVRWLGMTGEIAHWEAVAAAIRTIQAGVAGG